MPSCTSDRPNSWATHRTLELPQSFVDAEPPGELTAWANALCCVYTHVEVSSTSVPRLTTYDGEVKTYQSSVSAIGAMETAYDDVCNMGMGSEDCQNQRSCVTAALDAAGLPLPPLQSGSDGSTWPIGQAVGVGIAGAVVIAVITIVAARLWTRRRRLRRPGTKVTKGADGSEALEVEPTPPASTAVTV